jgi:hypothetical protein
MAMNLRTRLRELRDYLALEVDEYDYQDALVDFLEQEQGIPADFHRDLPGVDDLDDDTRREFRRWLLDNQIPGLLRYEEPESAPAYLFFEDVKVLPARTWLVHFTRDALGVARRGFLYGWPEDEERSLALTHLQPEERRRRGPGWNFAFRLGSHHATQSGRLRPPDQEGYGREAVLFRVSAVEAFHNGDGYQQVIFWGPSVRCVIPLVRTAGWDWTIHGAQRAGTFDEVAAYAIRHPARHQMCVHHRRLARPARTVHAATR